MKIGIKAKILIIMLIVAFIPSIIGMTTAYIKGSDVLRKAIGGKFLDLTRQFTMNIDNSIREGAAEAILMAANPAVRQLVYRSSTDVTDAEEYLYLYLGLVSGHKSHASVSVYDETGDILMKAGHPAAGKQLDADTISLLKAGSDRVVVGKLFWSEITQSTMLPITIPVYTPGGTEFSGALSTLLDIDNLFEQTARLDMGDTGHINIVVSGGDVIYDPLVPAGAPPFSRDTMDKIEAAKESWFIGIDEHGLESIISFSLLSSFLDDGFVYAGEGNWYAVMTQATSEAFSVPIRDVLFGAGIPVFIFATLLIFAIYLTLRKIVQPISILKEGVAIIGTGNLKHRIEINTGDEIEDLAVEFNNMTAELKEVYEGLEDKVRERTIEIEKSNIELEKANRLKSEFLANMSHELRTPLNSIIGFSEVLLDGLYGETNERQMKYLNNIHKSGKHLLELINDILNLSKIEAGKMELVLDEFPLLQAIEEVQSIITPLARQKGVKLSITVADEPEMIIADRLKLKQIMYNLIGNAIKFTPSGGSVTLNALMKDGFFQISVADTGIGIPENSIEVIFESFRQADGSHSRDYEGTGLGLTLTKKFVEMHGGSIKVESKTGEGSIFTFTIPACDVSDDALTETDGTQQTSGRGAKAGLKDDKNLVLVIEDNKKTSELLAIYLHEGGYRVAQAFDGEEALNMAKELKPYAITLDIMMPKKDGWELLKLLKDNKETRDIPVVVISMVDNREMGYALGAVDTLTKPISKNDLLKALSRYTFPEKVKNRNVSILIVDDDPDTLKILTAILEPAGFDVVKASGGREAIEIVKRKQPDVMILDLIMPEVNGFDVIYEMSRNNLTRDISIIILTAKDITPGDKKELNGHIFKIIGKGTFNKDRFLEEIYSIGINRPAAGPKQDSPGIFD